MSQPLWLDRVERLLTVASQFVLDGEVDDHWLVDVGGHDVPLPTDRAVWSMLERRGFSFLLAWDPIAATVRLVGGDEAAATALCPELGRALGASGLADLVTRLLTASREVSGALLVEHASRMLVDVSNPSPAEVAPLAAVQRGAAAALTRPVGTGQAALHNPVLWLTHRAEDLPAWFLGDTRGLRSLTLDPPDLETRTTIAGLIAPGAPGYTDADEQDRATFVSRLADATDGVLTREFNQVIAIMRDRELPLDDVEDAVTAHRVGMTDNPWKRSTLQKRVMDGEAQLRQRVKGQDRAVAHVLDVLKRAATGLTAAHRGASSGPRGVLFLAGPTGVGKTELAKSVAELVYGSQDAMIRFDMSEFAAEHAEARLVGAPPGYVGHDAGGELTNAVRNRPFSVLLFDEIEKAHPRVLDKFLQVLDDGRLTDSHGRMTDFRESLVVFTSNLGVYRQVGQERVLQVDRVTMAPSEVEELIRTEIHRHFNAGIGRPELLNRIGDNIVVCQFIDEPTADLILDSMLATVIARVDEEQGVTLDVSAVVDELRLVAHAALDFGGRGIGNVVEARLVNPLARALFDAGLRDTNVSLTRLFVDDRGIAQAELA